MTHTLDIFEKMDQYGPEKVLAVSDPKTGMKGVLVIDNTARGPGKGGCRMSPTLSIDEMARLARAMTWKWAIVDFKYGGAKAGICNDPRSPHKEEIIRAFVKALQKYIPSEYVFGLDMGLDESDAAIVVDECNDISASMGTPPELGGIPYDQLGAAGFGAKESARIALEMRNSDLKNTTVSIQGFGALGNAAASFLSEAGATIVAVSTVEGVLHNQNGLDIPRLVELYKIYGDSAVYNYNGGKILGLGEELLLDADVLILGAIQDVLHQGNADMVKADIIIEGANMPTTKEAEEILFSKGKLIVPDIVANAGGVIAAAIGMDARNSCMRPEPDIVYDLISCKMEQNVTRVIEEAVSKNIKTREAAMGIARERVVKAMQFRGNKQIRL